MAELLVGPLLRFVSDTEAAVWVETDRSCVVEVLGHTSPTFSVSGHHYALVVIRGLEPGQRYTYQVALDGAEVWPIPGPWPPSVIRTLEPDRPVCVAIGSCRVGAPLSAPWSGGSDASPPGLENDALDAMAHRAAHHPDALADHLVLAGDQIYADQPSPTTKAYIRSRRPGDTATGAAGDTATGGAADFEEYAFAYRDSWTEPSVRWLLSTVPTTMIFDDHDVDDGWNSSQAWVDAAAERAGWAERLTGALAGYWVYQHLGNLAPDQLAADEVAVRATTGADLTSEVMALARRSAGIDGDGAPPTWSSSRDIGPARLVVLDSRSIRVLEEGHRSMLTDRGWEWLEAQLADVGPCHLMLVTSVPLLLPTFVDRLEAWSDRTGAGAWGRPGQALASRLRSRLGLEHWPAYGDSVARALDLLTDLADGRRGVPPASVLVVSGEVHYAYVAQVAGRSGRSPIIQIVSSPLRNPSDRKLRALQRVSATAVAAVAGRTAAWLAGAPSARHRWRVTTGPWFHNVVAFVDLGAEVAHLRVYQTLPVGEGTGITLAHESDLTPSGVS